MNLKRALLVLLTIICLTVMVAGMVLYERHQDLKRSSVWVTHTYDVISKIENLYSNIEKLIALQRGYLLSHEKRYVARYHHSVDDILEQMNALKTLTGDNKIQQERLQAIHDNFVRLEDTLNGRMNMLNGPAQPGSENIRTHVTEGRAIADVIRDDIAEILIAEKALLAKRQQQEQRQESMYFYTLFIAIAASIGIMLVANGLILTLAARHKAATKNLTLAEQDLLKTRERLELAMRGTSDGVFDWNFETGEIYFSARFRDMLGYSPEELPSTLEGFRNFIHPEDADEVFQSIDDYLQNKVPQYIHEFRIQHKDGSWRWHLARGAAVFDDLGKGQRLVGAHTDITEQKETEVRLRASNKELEEFTYIASHDLRSPLVNLKGFASELQYCLGIIRDYVRRALAIVPDDNAEEIKTIVEKDMPQALNFINTSVTRMEKLTRAILELSRAGRRKLEPEPLHTRTIVDNCLKTLQHQIVSNGTEVVVGDLPDTVGDPVAIEQVFGNIIDNAIKYLDPQRPGRIEISGSHSVSETTYHIRDNGRGIREEDLQKVFEIFKRAGNNADIPGEGMGMSYVQAILRRHGGTIWCTSTLGQGTDFYFSLPHHVKKEHSNV